MSWQRLLGLQLVTLAVGCSTVRVDRQPHDDPSDPSEPSGCPALRVDFDKPGVNSALDVLGAASGPECSSIVVGSYGGDVDVGGALPYEATWTGWVARLDASGAVSWRRTLADGADEVSYAHGVLADAVGNIWVNGSSQGTLLLDGVEVLQGSGDYVIALSAAGELRWAARLPGFPSHGALRDDGSVSYFVAAGVLEEISFDGASGASTTRELAAGDVGLMGGATRGELTVLVGCTGSQFTIADQLVAKQDETPDGNGYPTCDLALFVVDRQGSLRWLRTFAETGFSPYVATAAIDDDGEVALIASFWGEIDLGDGSLAASSIGPGMRLLVGTFSAAGELGEAGAFGEASFTFGWDVVPTSQGDFAVSGNVYDGSVDFGDAPIESGDLSYMGFQVDLSADGELSSSQAQVGLERMFESGVGAPFLVSRRMSDEGADLGVTFERTAE